jgi:hypothetical protein
MWYTTDGIKELSSDGKSAQTILHQMPRKRKTIEKPLQNSGTQIALPDREICRFDSSFNFVMWFYLLYIERSPPHNMSRHPFSTGKLKREFYDTVAA